MTRAVLLSVCFASAVLGMQQARAQLTPYDPYAAVQERLPPVAPDGTLRWGVFYKSAEMQQAYERLWNLGACRNTNPAITIPVQENRLLIDRLPESEFTGVVRGTVGSLAGGVVAFVETQGDSAHLPLFAQLHPAGVSKVSVCGSVPAALVRPGMWVRVKAEVDARGRAVDPAHDLEIVAPQPGFKPDPVRPGRMDTLVGLVTQTTDKALLLRVDAGTIRRLRIPLAADAVASIVADRFDLIAPGDTVEVKGRLWAGEGCSGRGTIFASHVTVQKPPLPAPANAAAARKAEAGPPAGLPN